MNDESLYDVKIYQLRVYIRQINPLIWRRILVRSDSTIADLHYTMQLAFGWDNYHLHQFIIKGKSYGIAYAGGISFSDNPRKITLEKLHFRPKERFVYEYNFTAGWELEVRVEKTVLLDPKKTYPVCIGGAMTSPDEDCAGPIAYMSLRQRYSTFHISRRIIELLHDEEKTDEEKVEGCRHQIKTFQYWSNIEPYDRRTINQRLKRFALKEEGWKELFEEVLIS